MNSIENLLLLCPNWIIHFSHSSISKLFSSHYLVLKFWLLVRSSLLPQDIASWQVMVKASQSKTDPPENCHLTGSDPNCTWLVSPFLWWYFLIQLLFDIFQIRPIKLNYITLTKLLKICKPTVFMCHYFSHKLFFLSLFHKSFQILTGMLDSWWLKRD